MNSTTTYPCIGRPLTVSGLRTGIRIWALKKPTGVDNPLGIVRDVEKNPTTDKVEFFTVLYDDGFVRSYFADNFIDFFRLMPTA